MFTLKTADEKREEKELYKEYFEDLYKKQVVKTLDNGLQIFFHSEFSEEGLNYHGKSNFLQKEKFDLLIDLIHEKQKLNNVHFVFFPTRKMFIKKMFSPHYSCIQDVKSLFNKNQLSFFETDVDSYVYFYEFNMNKEWAKTTIILSILSYLYHETHPHMDPSKVNKKTTLYLLRMVEKIKTHMNKKERTE